MAATPTTGGSLWRQRLCWALAAYALVAGAISFLGWALDIPRLTDWEDNGISIQPNAAVLVMLSGAALLLLQLRQHRIALAFGALVGVMGGLMLLQHVLGVDLGFNHQLTFGREWGGAGTVTRGRVGPPASTCFTLAGAALVLLGYSHAKSGRAHLRRFVPVLGLAVSVIALFSLIGYLSGAEEFYAIPWLTAIALQTSTMLMAIAVGLIASVPEHQPMRLLASSSGTGVLARRTLPMIVLLPLLLSGAATRGEARGWYDHGTGRSLLLLGIVLLGALSMWWALRILDRQERSARDSAVSLADTLESINDGFIRLDAQWRFTYVNRQAERFCDLGRGTLVGRTLHETFPSVLGTHPQQAFDRALREQTPVELESYHRSRQRWYAIKAHPMRDGGLALLIQDMTDRKHTLEALRRSEEQLASLFNVTSVGMAQTDPVTRRFVRVNAALCAITGYNDAELLATTVDELNHPDDRERDREVYDRLARGSSAYELEKRYVRKDGRAVWVHVTSNVVRDTAGRPVQAFSIVQDIGVRRRNEEALRDAARRKDEFLAMLAHELRNPLAPVRNAVKILYLKGPAVPELQWARDVIDRQVQHMTRLIDDLLDVSRISRGKIKLQRERVDLAKVVHRAIEACRPLTEQHEHELSVLLPAEPVQVDGDFTRLVQVVSNLLDNAAKYSERGGRIVVSAERQDGEGVVTVRDFGIGLAPDMLSKVFEIFEQADGFSDKSQGGLGIGLTLVKRLVEMHGGRVEARSEGLGKGSAFVVRLPLSSEPASTARPTRRAQSGTTPVSSHRVLIVDDNRDAADSLAMMMQMMGNDARTAYDGAEAVRIARELRPDVVLLDIGLPTLDGYDAARAIRSESWGTNVVLIAVTGWGQEDDRRRSREAGFDHHLVKPVDPSALVELLASCAPGGFT